MGHERSTTTLDLYARRTDDGARILEALTDPDEGDLGDEGSAGAGARTRRGCSGNAQDPVPIMTNGPAAGLVLSL